MLESLAAITSKLRQANREAANRAVDVRVKCVKLSFMDHRFKADAWIVNQTPGRLALCLGDYNLASIAGNPLDVPSMNQMLQRFFYCRPR